MQHGDVQVSVSLRGEPQKLLTYWRGSLRDILPTSASVAVVRPLIKGRYWFDYHDPSFYFEGMTRSEKKRAELSISDLSLKMQPGEIEIARHLTDILFDWLSGRDGIPVLNQPIPNARIGLSCAGGVDLIDVVEKFGDPEVLSRAQVGLAYLQGEPRRPDVRWLPNISSLADKVPATTELGNEKSLAEGQGKQARALIDRIIAIHRKRVAARRAKVNKRATEIFGYGSGVTYGNKPITDEMLDRYEYAEILAWLDEAAKEKKPREKIRSWRGQ
jgi:hypothetical protein